MQQNSATLIYDLKNTIKGTVESYLKKLAQPFKTVQFQGEALKIASSSKSLGRKKKRFWATLKNVFGT